MIGQVQIINGVKQIVPVTDTTPVDEVTVNNMQSVTSNAVARAIASANPEIVDDQTITDCNNAYEVGKVVTYKLPKTATNAPSPDFSYDNYFTLTSYAYISGSQLTYIYQIARFIRGNVAKMGVYTRNGLISSGSTPVWYKWKEVYNGEEISLADDNFNNAFELSVTRVYSLGAGATNGPADVSANNYYWSVCSFASATSITQIAYGFPTDSRLSEVMYKRGGKYNNVTGVVTWSTWVALATKDDLTSKSNDKQGSWGILGGAAGSDKTNFVDLIRTLTGANYGGGICGGSINTTTTSCGIPAGWYNFLYIPHRTGIGSDNYNYGNLLVFPMTQTNTYFYKIQMSGATILNAVRYSGTQL